MQGMKRRVVYVILFEIIAIVITTYGFAFITGRDIGESSIAATITSVLAIVWNLSYNALFEFVEAKRKSIGRSLVCRVFHAVGFEIGLAMMVVPMLALILKISLFTALMTNLGIMLFFMGYTFFFSMAFDRVFGLPLSARGKV